MQHHRTPRHQPRIAGKPAPYKRRARSRRHTHAEAPVALGERVGARPRPTEFARADA